MGCALQMCDSDVACQLIGREHARQRMGDALCVLMQ